MLSATRMTHHQYAIRGYAARPLTFFARLRIDGAVPVAIGIAALSDQQRGERRW